MRYAAEPFPLDVLTLPALAIFVLGTMIAFRVTRHLYLSLVLAGLKAGTFLIYYNLVFDGKFTFFDDWTYLRKGQYLLDHGISVVNLFNHLPEVFATTEGHFLYYLYNADSFRLFGEGYYAPVALNIVLTFAAAGFMAATTRGALGYSRRLTAGFFVYMSLHPTVIAWSTVMNGKDTLVMTCTAIAVYAVSLTERRRYGRATVLALGVGLVLLFTRFYVPLLMMSALLGALLLAPGNRRRLAPWLLIPAGVAGVVGVLGVDSLLYGYDRLREGFVNPLFGVPRILLTPIPFNTEESYAFLDLPQVFHWTLILILLYGGIRIWRRSTLTARFVVIYFLIALFLYGMFSDLQGPRHRYQLEGLIALFQFHGLLGVFRKQVPRHRPERYERRVAATPNV